MRNTFVTALAAATILSGGMFAARAAIMLPAPPSALGAAADATLVRQASIVCGGNGCGVVQTKAAQRRKLVPLGHG